MPDSKLVQYTHYSPNITSPRRGTIRGVAIHCTAGSRYSNARTIADLSTFTRYNAKNGASCHYAVGGDGSIAQICPESARAWCTSNSIDHYLITIEVASDGAAPQKVTDKAVTALIELLADICKRNGIKKLLWRGDKSLMGQWDKQNMVVHRWTANKACPGDVLYAKHGEIAAAVNQKLMGEDENMDVSKLTNAQCYEIMAKAMEHAETLPEPEWSHTAGSWAKATAAGITDGSAPERPMKRDECITVLGRLGLLK